jgi:hypothetical protein
MTIICSLVFLAMLFSFVFRAVVSGGMAGYDGLVRSGTPAIGILLSVAPTSNGSVRSVSSSYWSPRGFIRIQQRQMAIDVEVPGYAPYVVDTAVYVPPNMLRDVLPGATVELRIDPKNRQNIAVVGPGVAFTGFASAAGNPAQMGLSQQPRRTS